MDMDSVQLLCFVLYIFGAFVFIVEGTRNNWSLWRTLRTALLFPLIFVLVLLAFARVALDALIRE